MSPIEWIASLSGIVCIAFLVRRSLWNYPFAILSVALFGWVFLDARLYSDALLQIFYLVINAYGWWEWVRSRGRAGTVMVERLGPAEASAWLIGGTIVTLGWGWLMATRTDAAFPWWDAAVAIPSVVAQALLARRRIETWLMWIAVDAVAVPLYATKELWAAAGLYVIYGAMSAWGLIDWIGVRRRQRGAA